MTPEAQAKVREALVACFSLMPNITCRDVSCGCLASKITAALSALDTPEQATPRSEGDTIYRLLNVGETIQGSDEYHDGKEWNRAWNLGGVKITTSPLPFRRALPVKAGEAEMSWDCLYCKKRLHKFNSPDHDSFCCGNHDCQSFGKAQWVVAVDLRARLSAHQKEA